MMAMINNICSVKKINHKYQFIPESVEEQYHPNHKNQINHSSDKMSD
jgi:hypothetical protein